MPDLNLEECSKLLNANANLAAQKFIEDMAKDNILADMLYYGYTPLTKWQRSKYKLADLKQRCKDIWTIVSGGDIHENCDY
jgi:hypothetical protein